LKRSSRAVSCAAGNAARCGNTAIVPPDLNARERISNTIETTIRTLFEHCVSGDDDNRGRRSRPGAAQNDAT
jgi:hypothetical protein